MASPTWIARRGRRSEVTRAVVVAASCVESARILLNSKSAPLAERSRQLERPGSGAISATTCTARPATGTCRSSSASRRSPTTSSASQIVWMPRWQNLTNPRQEKFIRGYSIYPTGGCGEFPWYHDQVEGFGASLKRDIGATTRAGVVLLPDPVAAELRRTTWTSTPR